MTTFLLIRHGAHDWLERGIAGRLQGVHLNARGREEAQALASHLNHLPVTALYSSPLARTWETAGFLAREWNLEIAYNAAFLEIDFGAWTGLPFDDLSKDPHWLEWNDHRNNARAPNGEWMHQVQSRAVDQLVQLAQRHPDTHVALVTHGDVIRAVLLQCLGRSLDDIHQLRVDPASVTMIEWDGEIRRPVLINFPAAETRMPFPIADAPVDQYAAFEG